MTTTRPAFSSSARPIKHVSKYAKLAPVKTIKIEVIDYKDVATLRKFVSDRGKIRARRITGATVQDQRKIAKAIKNAREMALLPYAGAGR